MRKKVDPEEEEEEQEIVEYVPYKKRKSYSNKKQSTEAK